MLPHRRFFGFASLAIVLLGGNALPAGTILITTNTTLDPAPRTLNTSGTYLVADSATLAFLNGLGASGTDGGVFAYNGSAAGLALTFAPDPSTVEDSGATLFQNNSADKHGGAISITNNRVLLTLANATFGLNSTGSGNGGALITNGTSQLASVTFTSNTAGASGGAFQNTGNATITRALFENNRSTTTGGAIHHAGNTLAFAGGTLANNTAGTNGGAVYNTGANTRSSFVDIVFISNTAAAGGALYANSGTVAMERVRFDGNAAMSSHGGAVYANTAASVTLIDAIFSNNTAGSNGGAIYTNRGTLTIRATTSATNTGNKSSGTTGASGGFLYITGTDAVVNFDITGAFTRYVVGEANAADRTLDTIASGGSGLAATNPIINKTGDGALVLNADNSNYRGAINITGGALLLGNIDAKLNAATYTVTGGALGGVGTLSGSVAFFATSTLLVDDGLLTIVATANTGVTLNAGAAIGGSGTLVLSGENNTLNLAAGVIGATVAADETLAITATLAGAGALEKRDAGTLILAAVENTFTGGVILDGGTLAITGAAQLGATANEIRFTSATGATLRIDADNQILENAIALAPSSTGVIDTRTNKLTLAGVLASDADSTLTKTGAGKLIFLDADATAFLGTLRIAQGSMQLATTAAAPATLMIGGTLAIENTTLAFTLHSGTASDGYLNSDRIFAAALDITGANTIDVSGHMQSGTYNLGSLAALASTAIITVDGAEQLDDFRRKAALATSGSLLLVETQIDMSRALTWTGGTGATANLWTGASAGQWTDTGTVTRFADGDHVIFENTSATIDIPAAVTVSDIIVSGNATTTFIGESITADAASVVTGTLTGATGRLHKTGAGTLALENTANTFHGGIVLEEGAIAFTRAGQLNTPVIAITGNATLALAATDLETELPAAITIASNKTATLEIASASTFVLNNTITGSGALAKTGAGTLTLAAPADYKGPTLIQAGTLRAAAANVFARDSRHTLQSAAALDLAGHDQIIAALTSNRGLVNLSTARLAVAGDYAAARGTLQLDLVLADGAEPRAGTLAISGSASGQTTVRIQLTDTRATANRSPLPASTPALITAGAASPGDAFALAAGSRLVVGAYDYLLLPDNAAAAREWSLVADNFSAELPAVAGTDAIALQTGRAAFDTILARLGDLRAHTPDSVGANGAVIWADGMFRRDTINQTAYTGGSIETAGMQAGAELRRMGDLSFSLGVFADFSESEMKLSRGTKTDAHNRGTGLYATLAARAWCIDAVLRGAKSDYDIAAPGAAAFETSGKTFGATLQAGRPIPTKSAWVIEPAAALAYQRHSLDDTTDSFGRAYRVDDFKSLTARLATTFSRIFEIKTGVLIPRARVSVIHEFDAESTVTVGDVVVKNKLGGLGAELDASLVWRADERWAFSAAIAARAGGKFDGYTLRLGAACAW